MATELIKGKSIDELEKCFSNDDIVNALGGLPPVKIHCSVLAHEALSAALEDYKKKKGYVSIKDMSNKPTVHKLD